VLEAASSVVELGTVVQVPLPLLLLLLLPLPPHAAIRTKEVTSMTISGEPHAIRQPFSALRGRKTENFVCRCF
jgi:hypothetical protein